MPLTAGLDLVLVVAQSSGDQRLLSQLLGANAGARRDWRIEHQGVSRESRA